MREDKSKMVHLSPICLHLPPPQPNIQTTKQLHEWSQCEWLQVKNLLVHWKHFLDDRPYLVTLWDTGDPPGWLARVACVSVLETKIYLFAQRRRKLSYSPPAPSQRAFLSGCIYIPWWLIQEGKKHKNLRSWWMKILANFGEQKI